MLVKVRQTRPMRRILKVSRVDMNRACLDIRQGVRYQQTREAVGVRVRVSPFQRHFPFFATTTAVPFRSVCLRCSQLVVLPVALSFGYLYP